MPADEGRPGPRHRGGVERGPHPERIALAKRTARPVPDGVAVLPVPRRIAGIEPGRRPSHVPHREVRREERIERPTQFRLGEPPVVGEPDHLRLGVHAGVRSAGPVDPLLHPVTEAGQRGLQDPLDRPFPRIDLEPGEVRSVVFDPWRGTGTSADRPRGVLSDASDQLDLDDLGRVAAALTEADDPGEPGCPVCVLGRDLVEQLGHDQRLVGELRDDRPARGRCRRAWPG